MMNKRIRSMVDEIFSEMKMTAENLALRDELMANAQARYEDSVAQGKSEEEAFVEVAASLEDVCGLLEEMKRMDEQQSGDAPLHARTSRRVRNTCASRQSSTANPRHESTYAPIPPES